MEEAGSGNGYMFYRTHVRGYNKKMKVKAVQASECADTFLNCRELGKGVAFINGFNLGRYWSEGPVQYLYIPAPLLKKGRNEIIIFETEGRIADTLTLEEQPVYVDVG